MKLKHKSVRWRVHAGITDKVLKFVIFMYIVVIQMWYNKQARTTAIALHCFH